MKESSGHTGGQVPRTHHDSKDGEPLVSVIITFLNAEQFLEDAIASVFSQTHAAWELLLVDDGSTDRSPTISRRYARKHPSKVRCLQHPRQECRRISTSRNLGIAHANGSYLAFLDADDVWMPNKLERQLSLLFSEPDAAMIYGSSVAWHSWTGKAKDRNRDQFVPVATGDRIYETVDLPMLSVCQIWLTASPSGILVRRRAAEAVGNFESGFDNLYEDQAFYFKLGLKSQVIASSECWYKYRYHPDSVCAVGARTGTQKIAKVRFLQWALEYLASSNTERPDLHEALIKELSIALPQKAPVAMLKTAIEGAIVSSDFRPILRKIPGVWSTWHLGLALCDAWLDSSARAERQIYKRDFSRADPWGYTVSELEMQRHQSELKMLDTVRGSNRFGRVLEVGCAEGVFTASLANRCESLLATDISEIALATAQERCQRDQRINFERMDLRVESLTGVFDLIVVIHVLEYIRNPLCLRRVRSKLVGGLRPGGYLLIGSCTGFDDFCERLWWSGYLLRGGQRITSFFAAHPKLSVIDSTIHPLPGSVSREILLRKSQ